MHPVVWGKAGTGPWTEEELDQFDKNGFMLVNNLFNEKEVEFMQNEVMAVKDEYLKQAAEKGGRVTAEFKAATEPTDHTALRSLFEVHKWHKMCSEICRDARILERAKQILDDDVYIHQSRINYQPGFTGTGFQWHSDFETWHVEDGLPAPRSVSAAVLLNDNHPYNGCLMVMPGSHKTFLSCVGATPEGNWEKSLREQQVYGTPDRVNLKKFADKHGITYCAAPAGSVLFFDCNLIHGSHNNITPYGRTNTFFVFNSLSNAAKDPFNAPTPRPEHISTRDPKWIAPLEPVSNPMYSQQA